MAPLAAVLALVLVSLLHVEVALGQTFSYSRGWKNGKRASGGADEPSLDDLCRVLVDAHAEHRLPYNDWRLLVDPAALHFPRSQQQRLSVEQPGPGGPGGPAEHEEYAGMPLLQRRLHPQ